MHPRCGALCAECDEKICEDYAEIRRNRGEENKSVVRAADRGLRHLIFGRVCRAD